MFSDTTIFLSIKPRYAEKILRRDKTIELRKTLPRIRPGDLILLYASSPVKGVIGYCTVEHILQDDPRKLWRKVKGRCAISKREYDSYYSGASVAIGIEVSNPHRFRDKFELGDLQSKSPGFVVPQSYRYVDFLERGLKGALEDAAHRAVPVLC